MDDRDALILELVGRLTIATSEAAERFGYLRGAEAKLKDYDQLEGRVASRDAEIQRLKQDVARLNGRLAETGWVGEVLESELEPDHEIIRLRVPLSPSAPVVGVAGHAGRIVVSS